MNLKKQCNNNLHGQLWRCLLVNTGRWLICDVSNVCQYFAAQAYDDMNGVPQGSVYAETFDYNTSQDTYISCSGPAYAKVLSLIQGNGKSSINATLDPTSPDCYSFYVYAPVTMDLAGQFDGNYRNSENGTGKQTYGGGVNYNYNFQNDDFSETFTGTNGFYSGTFTGYAYTQHYTNRQQVKWPACIGSPCRQETRFGGFLHFGLTNPDTYEICQLTLDAKVRFRPVGGPVEEG